MNSLLQCLFYTKELNHAIVTTTPCSNLFHTEELVNEKDSKPSSTGGLAESFWALMQAVRSCQVDKIHPLLISFKEWVDRTTDKFHGNLEHDAQEFLITLRGALNDKYGTEHLFHGKGKKKQICTQCGESLIEKTDDF